MQIGVIGLGTVGFGVIEILTNEKERLEKEYKQEITIKYGCSLEPVDLPKGVIWTADFNDVLNDEEVDTIVELIGGTTFAKKIILDAFAHGKNVVTANKALIAHHAKELFTAANTNNCHFFYEASVGGGIPVVIPEKESLIANNIKKIEGILNGTTNFILTLMEEKNLSFEEALKIARDNGFVEANEALDLDGIDAAHKIAILTMNAYKQYINFDSIVHEGIRNVTKLDMDICNELGYKIKLIAKSEMLDGKIILDIAPTLIPVSDMISNVSSSYNVVEITCDYLENVLFYGKGAGRYVTASAVVSDILKTLTSTKWDYQDYKDEIDIYPTTVSKYYIRSDKPLQIKNAKEQIVLDQYVYLTDSMKKEDLNIEDATIFRIR